MPYKCTSGLTVTRNPTCVSSALEASERKALWYDISVITLGRSLSSAHGVAGALLNTGLSIGICVLKVGVKDRTLI